MTCLGFIEIVKSLYLFLFFVKMVLSVSDGVCWASGREHGFPSGQSVSWTLKTDPELEHSPIWNLWHSPKYS